MSTDMTARLEQLVIERGKMTADRDALIERIAELDTQIGSLLDEGTHDVADYRVVITVPQRIDAKKIAAAFPIAQHPELYKAAPDTAAVRRHIGEADLAPYLTAGRKQVTLR